MTEEARAGASTPPSEGLVRAIGRWTMVALMINMIVGSGIFGLPGRIHAQAGVYGLFAYAGCAVVIMSITLCLAEASSRFTATGGPYLYTSEAFGPFPGFLIGWLMAITRMTSLAIIAGIMADYLAYFWPIMSEGLPHTTAMVASLVLLAAVNVLGVRQGSGLATALTVGKLVPILLFIGVGLFFLEPQRFRDAPAVDGASLTQAVLMLVFAFGGFESAIVICGEMKNPRRDAPFALLAGIGVATVLYVLIQVVCIGTLPELATSKRPLADAAARFAGGLGGGTIALGAFVSTLGALGGSMLAGPRLLFAMAGRGQMPRWVGALHPRFRTPYVAILLLTLGGVTLSVTGTFAYLVGLNVLTRLMQYLASALAVLVLRGRDPAHPAPFRVPFAFIVVPATSLACVWLVSRSTPRELRDFGIVLALGAVMYGLRAVARRVAPAPETPAV